MKRLSFLLAAIAFGSTSLAATDASDILTGPAGPYVDDLFTIIQTEKPQYPQRMFSEGVMKGEVNLFLEVDAEGQLVDHLFVAYTHQPFADEVKRVLKTWRFRPPREEGKAYSTVAEIAFTFHQKGVSAIQAHAHTRAYLDLDYVRAPTPAHLLDRAPVAVNKVSPTYPEQLKEQGMVGRVPVTYFIDETGAVRMPIASSLADSFLGGLAVAAIKQWRFEPPTRQGRPVLTRVTTSFVFGEQGLPTDVGTQ